MMPQIVIMFSNLSFMIEHSSSFLHGESTDEILRCVVDAPSPRIVFDNQTINEAIVC